ncbi:putative enzyme related to lactoylglutathione lyase [Allocatelliglobosispora scoriae]|uniref:Putative enzyme related to lactoylglutathione lyase n=1 Tax=Allocatelliglobosispora scoriae TaxID=643052 RepID=A0A841C1B3_9ACTN|nr:VOC family protein [Allocatelliglobosispora scoriae]MBB5872933.1 putative enzyme related to lactoylglutathione lyase [Allocatelliglobosispora scoriae]
MTHAPGTPSWVDLGTSDLEAATTFYTELFGWTAHVSPEPEAQGYTIFNLDGTPAAGAGPLFSPDQPSAWSVYLATDDADETAERVVRAGGSIAMAPFDVMGFGRMAVFLDPSGGAFSVWQGGSMPGADVLGEPGSFGWTELNTRDLAGSKRFYGAVFGWTADDQQFGPRPYTTFRLDGTAVAGMMPLDADVPEQVPPHWMPYFVVEDCDDSAALAEKLGGTVKGKPAEIPTGRFAGILDPQGAAFIIITPQR